MERKIFPDEMWGYNKLEDCWCDFLSLSNQRNLVNRVNGILSE